MKSKAKELLDRGIAAMVAAVEIYNKPSFPYRTEAFSILAINGWELLLKAKLLADNQNKLSCLYVYESRTLSGGKKSNKKYIKRTDANNPFTHSLSYLGKKLTESKTLHQLAWDNIQILIELRDSSVHFYNQSPAFRARLQEIGAACVKNFATAVWDWFGRTLSEFELHLMPIALIDLPSSVDGFILNAEEKNFLSFLECFEVQEENHTSNYSISVNIELKFVRSKAKGALSAKITNDPSAPAVRLTAEQIRDKYPWDYKMLYSKCQERYSDFKINDKFHNIRRALESNTLYVHIQYLDDSKPKSGKKPYFNRNILKEFDKHYTKKEDAQLA